ncbi:serine/threonine-protein kinase [Spirillospora sp. NBC_01491]|uniref:serine/threonine-protein kinase n=1 Tax=Spirillospora sp. NBC_01491 TaxID=2976007 RepID=UPI002E358641|nr:serine/threonine-protein kinase [Spirillospora sp. NBC_01491]
MPAAEALRPEDPRRLGPYRLSGRLGSGGQGVVYAGEAVSGGGGRVAVKLLRTGLGNDPEARARFIRELETAKRVSRFCTAAVLDADLAGDRPYIVSEYVDGPSLHRVVTTDGPRTGGTLERLAVGTATALVTIHQAGVVHRDFKPHNVLLGPDGPRVIDFGVARALDGATITSSGMIGTPAYMAPEQFSGERAGPPADVFAWAATLVFASCGRPPFGDDTLTAVVGRIVRDDPDLGELTGPLRDLVLRCLAKDPAARPPAPEALRTLLGEQEVQATGPMPPAALHAAAGGAVTGGAAGPGWGQGAGPGPGAGPGAGPGSGAGAAPGAMQATMVNAAGPYPPSAYGPAPARRVSGVVAVSAAVIAVAVAAVVGIVVLSDRGGGTGAQPPPPVATPSATSSKPKPKPSPTRSKTRRPKPKPTRKPPPTGIPAAYKGTWKGRLRQSDGKMLNVILTLPAGRGPGRIRYPDQGCGGVESFAGHAGGTLTLRERITDRPDKCVDSGTVTVTRKGPRTILFNYTGTEKGRTWGVSGTMTRS